MTIKSERLKRLSEGKDVIGADGIARPVEVERELNLAFARVFGGEGQKIVDYLRSITVLNIQGPRVSDDELRHLEGQRFLVAIIERRIENGRSGKPELPESAR